MLLGPDASANRGLSTRPLPHSATVRTSIDEVDASAWDRLCRSAGPFMDRRFIRAVETSMVRLSRFWHVIVYDQCHRPIACACYSTLRADPAVISDDRLKRFLS